MSYFKTEADCAAHIATHPQGPTRHVQASPAPKVTPKASALREGAVARRKYGNVPVVIDGIKFASGAEGRRYTELKVMERAGEISGLKAHPEYELRPNGVRIGKFTADFEYLHHHDGVTEAVTEDVKSGPTMTTAARLRMKLFAALYGREVRVVGVRTRAQGR